MSLHPWHERFAGKWCLVQIKPQGGIEGHVVEITESAVCLDQTIQVYQAIPQVREVEAIIEDGDVVIPISEVTLIRSADRKRAERFCSGINGGRLLRAVERMPKNLHTN